MLAAIPARPKKPKYPAIIASKKKMMAQPITRCSPVCSHVERLDDLRCSSAGRNSAGDGGLFGCGAKPPTFQCVKERTQWHKRWILHDRARMVMRVGR
jgi:hypothetical protein